MDKRGWPQVAEAIAALAEVVEGQNELDVWRERLHKYICRDFDGIPDADAKPGTCLPVLLLSAEPFIFESHLHLSADAWRTELYRRGTSATLNEIGLVLSRLGFLNVRLLRRWSNSDKPISRRLWRIATSKFEEDVGTIIDA